MGIAELILGILGGAAKMGIDISNNTKNINAQEDAQTYAMYAALIQMLREDTAVQRRVRDLRAAGLSPTLAAGSAAQTGALPLIKPTQHNLDIGPGLTMASQLANNMAQTNLMNKQATKIEVDNAINLEKLPEQIKGIKANAFKTTQDAIMSQYQNKQFEETGIPKNGGIVSGTLRDLSSWGLKLAKEGLNDLQSGQKREVMEAVGKIKDLPGAAYKQYVEDSNTPFEQKKWYQMGIQDVPNLIKGLTQ